MMRQTTSFWRRLRGTALLAFAVTGPLACTDPIVAPDPDPDPSPNLEIFDAVMNRFMTDHSIEAGLLGIMRGGEVVYEQGFGWLDRDRQQPLSGTAMMRLASVSKPFTAAAIHELVGQGRLSLDDFAFDLGQDEGGILEIDPYPEIGDPRLGQVTLRHLLTHRAGWDRDQAGDLTVREIEIADAMGLASPPGRLNTVRFILGQPLQFTPGEGEAYSNVGYLVLGLIIEEVSGSDYLDFVQTSVLAPFGVPPGEVIQGRTFPADRSSREPWYDDDTLVVNVFDSDGPQVRWPEGGWDHEARVAQGGLVASTRALLSLLQAYQVAGPDIGTRRSGSESVDWRWNHTGSLPGTNALARQRGDGVNYVVLFNKRPSSGDSFAARIRTEIDQILDQGDVIWP